MKSLDEVNRHLAYACAGLLPLLSACNCTCRTHAGILDAAASITSVLSACFPHLLDKLPRERAFFPGPQPLLLGSLDNMDDLSILLSSDPGRRHNYWFGYCCRGNLPGQNYQAAAGEGAGSTALLDTAHSCAAVRYI